MPKWQTALPNAVDPDKVKADCADGVLTVRMEKAEETRPRKIQIASSV